MPLFHEEELGALAAGADQPAVFRQMSRPLLRRFITAGYVENLGASRYHVTAAGKAALLKRANPKRRRRRKNKGEPTPRNWDIHYKKAYFRGRHVITIEAGTPADAFRRAQILAQRGVKGLAGLVEHPRSAFQITPAREQARANPLYLVVPWGKPYGEGPHYVTSDGREVTMYRKGQKVRFYSQTGGQVGPEQANVAPAVAYAHSMGWREYKLPARLARNPRARISRLMR